jgi:hypothetical protein
MAEHGMADRRFAEPARHRDMLCVIEMLVAEENDLPFQKGVANLIHLLRRQGLFEIDAADLGANVQRQRDDFDCCIRGSIAE